MQCTVSNTLRKSLNTILKVAQVKSKSELIVLKLLGKAVYACICRNVILYSILFLMEISEFYTQRILYQS